MSPITHFLVGWTLAEPLAKEPRTRAAIALASAAPDLDGLGVAIDLANRALGRPESDWFGTLHHVLLHGGFGAVLAVGIAFFLGIRRGPGPLLVCVSFHLHLVCDYFGSRGPVPGEIWPIHYLAPFSRAWTFSFAHQWALNAWPNMLLTACLMGWALLRAVATGVSPLSVFSRKWDAEVVIALQARFSRVRPTAPARPGARG